MLACALSAMLLCSSDPSPGDGSAPITSKVDCRFAGEAKVGLAAGSTVGLPALSSKVSATCEACFGCCLAFGDAFAFGLIFFGEACWAFGGDLAGDGGSELFAGDPTMPSAA